jgi:hypothetical protein
MYSQESGLYRSLEFDGATYDAIFNEELQWLMMEGQAFLASEQMGLWVDASEREACIGSVSPSPQPTNKEPAEE